MANLVGDGPRVAGEGIGPGRFRNGTVYDNRYAWFWEVGDGGTFRSVTEYFDTRHVARLLGEALG